MKTLLHGLPGIFGGIGEVPMGFESGFFWYLSLYTGELHHWRPTIHTIRKGFRWRKGMDVHMATGVMTNEYHQFNTDIHALQYCTGTQEIWIRASAQRILVCQKDYPEAPIA